MHIDFFITMLLVLEFDPIFLARISKYYGDNNSTEILQNLPKRENLFHLEEPF